MTGMTDWEDARPRGCCSRPTRDEDSLPSIAARPAPISAMPAKWRASSRSRRMSAPSRIAVIGIRKVTSRLRSAGRGDQAEIEDVGEAGGEQGKRDHAIHAWRRRATACQGGSNNRTSGSIRPRR